jgi:hypothetical protein
MQRGSGAAGVQPFVCRPATRRSACRRSVKGGGGQRAQSEEYWIKQAEKQEAAEASKHASREATVRRNLLALRQAARDLDTQKEAVQYKMEQELAKRRQQMDAEQQVGRRGKGETGR